jgi:hypothetical protein
MEMKTMKIMVWTSTGTGTGILHSTGIRKKKSPLNLLLGIGLGKESLTWHWVGQRISIVLPRTGGWT